MNSIDQLGTDIAGEMLLALTTEDKADSQPVVPVAEMVSYLKKHVDLLSIQDRKTIGEILIMNDLKQHLKECSEGTIINLRVLDKNIIRQMYDLMMYKINKQ